MSGAAGRRRRRSQPELTGAQREDRSVLRSEHEPMLRHVQNLKTEPISPHLAP